MKVNFNGKKFDTNDILHMSNIICNPNTYYYEFKITFKNDPHNNNVIWFGKKDITIVEKNYSKLVEAWKGDEDLIEID